MTFLLIKKGGHLELLSPNTYGLETWGANVQEYLTKKRKFWYITRWSAGNAWVEDSHSEYRLNVICESSDLDEIVGKVVEISRSELPVILDTSRKLLADYISIAMWVLGDKNE